MMLDKAKGFRKGRRDRSATCGAVSGRSVLALLSMGLCGLMAPTSGMAAACPPPPSVQTPGTIPGDVCGGAAAGSAESDFDALAWQAFRYLVWPASANSRGMPDATRPITDLGGPRTFETLKADWETFKPGAVAPSAWADYPSAAEPCANAPSIAHGDLVLASYSKFGDVREFLDSPVANLLVAQNNTYVRYLAAYNQTVYEKIVGNQLYDPAVYQQAVANSNGAPVQATTQDNGALTVKSAWIEMPGADCAKRDNSARFYMSCAWIQDPVTLACRKTSVGLVGFHITLKTPSRPQWIWTTFEQVDNVPDSAARNATPGASYTFNNGDPAAPMGASAPPSYLIPRPTGTPAPATPPQPFQVERLQQITNAAKAANAAWQAQLSAAGSVWRNYQMVMVQWPLKPGFPDLDAQQAGPIPSCSFRGGHAAVNTAMETFLQTGSTCSGGLSRTCMTCHDNARAADFVWSIPMNPYRSAQTALTVNPPRVQALATLRSIVQGAK